MAEMTEAEKAARAAKKDAEMRALDAWQEFDTAIEEAIRDARLGSEKVSRVRIAMSLVDAAKEQMETLEEPKMANLLRSVRDVLANLDK